MITAHSVDGICFSWKFWSLWWFWLFKNLNLVLVLVINMKYKFLMKWVKTEGIRNTLLKIKWIIIDELTLLNKTHQILDCLHSSFKWTPWLNPAGSWTFYLTYSWAFCSSSPLAGGGPLDYMQNMTEETSLTFPRNWFFWSSYVLSLVTN